MLVMVANIAGFGVLWVAKFLFLDKIMFGSQRSRRCSRRRSRPPPDGSVGAHVDAAAPGSRRAALHHAVGAQAPRPRAARSSPA